MTNFLGNNSKSTLMAHIGALICVAGWGLSFVATKIVMSGGPSGDTDGLPLTPTEAYIYRFALAYILIFLISHKQLFCNSLKDELQMLVCGMCSGSVYFIAENTALQLTFTSNVSLLSATSPLVTVLLVGILYKSERPGRGLILGSCVAFVGVACVILNSTGHVEVRPVGDMLALSTAFTWAIYSLVVKKLNVVYDAMFITRKTFFYGLITALPFLLLEPHIQNPIAVLVKGWPWVDGCLMFLVLFPSIISFYLWAVTVKCLGAVVSNNYMYLQPVVTVIASAIILNERIPLLGYIGFALILFGLWLGSYLERRSKQRLL